MPRGAQESSGMRFWRIRCSQALLVVHSPLQKALFTGALVGALRVPDSHSAIFAARGNLCTIRTEGNAINGPVVSFRTIAPKAFRLSW